MCSSAAALAQPAPTTPGPFVAESLGNGAVPVDGAWQFHLGDKPACAQPGIEDATGRNGWEEIKTNALWGAQSHPNHAGYACWGVPRRSRRRERQRPEGRHDAEAVAFGQDDDITVLTLTCIGPGNRAFGEPTRPAHGVA
jgi:hypothetical protein